MTPQLDTTKITAATKKRFGPVIAATSNTINGNSATQWNGAAALGLFCSATRDIAALAVTARNARCIPSATTLHVMSHIPQRLHMASCRLISEALPAILSCAEDKELAKFHLSQSLQTFNTYQQPVLMALHQKMQSETAQMSEVQNWTGQGGLLIEAVRGVMWQFLVFTTASLELAPASNSQSPMLAQEVAMHFGELESILKRLSS